MNIGFIGLLVMGCLIFRLSFIDIDRLQKFRKRKVYILTKFKFLFFRWKYIIDDMDFKSKIIDEKNLESISMLSFWMQIIHFAIFSILILLEILYIFSILTNTFLVAHAILFVSYLIAMIAIPIIMGTIQVLLAESYYRKSLSENSDGSLK